MILGGKFLENLANTGIGKERITEPFIIISAKFKLPSSLDMAGREYLFVYTNKIRRKDGAIGRQIAMSRKTAYKLIDMFDMQIACNGEDGIIWELPGKPYYEKYKDQGYKYY